MFARSFSRVLKFKTQMRKMAGGGHAAPPAEGIEGMIRTYLPGDHHVSMAIIGIYFSLYMVSGLFSSKKAIAAPVAVVAPTTSGAIPSVDSPEFADWLCVPGNIEKALA
ncbi:hypothetical protein B484DRAFT_446427 [Ochromonadaceae sp. CCMP2298]|nr:hypothetical protein B484DRAFT_446427 [Ochromonadaceae sp. CCMP2298]|mmetsp:Transcript_4065/g.9129  ORF Transcript_4065/g.9129 Transcript_4065/m.9129 type:complete len:109 (-) Transcript_4065:161-487(-)